MYFNGGGAVGAAMHVRVHSMLQCTRRVIALQGRANSTGCGTVLTVGDQSHSTAVEEEHGPLL